jgi:hypothetical protein
MIRGLFTGIAACALMTGAAFAQDYSSTTVVTRSDAPSWTPVASEDGYYSDDGTYHRYRSYDRDYAYDSDGRRVVVRHYYSDRYYHDPGARALGGGAAGAGVGAAIGCIITIPIGCAPGAAIGAAVGGGTGAVAGAASTPPPHYHDYDRDDY